MLAFKFASKYLPFMEARRDVFQAIADPTRRAIILLITLKAMTPNAIAEHFDTTRQAVSKHLRILTECQLVKQEHQGREIYYQLEETKMKEIDQWLEKRRRTDGMAPRLAEPPLTAAPLARRRAPRCRHR